MRALVVLLSLSLLTACAPLQPHSSAWGDAGEVAGRTVLCAVSLCMSELGLYQNAEDAKRRTALSDDRHDDAALMGLGMALSGGGPFTPRPVAPAVRPLTLQCTSATIGTATYLNCP